MSTEHIPTPSNDQTPIAIFWFRRDLRIEDNTALTAALDKDIPVLPLFIFDRHILNELAEDDARVNFIHRSIQRIKEGLKDHGSDIICLYGEPVTIWKALILKYNIAAVFTNRDYEPYAIGRDKEIAEILTNKNIPFLSFKDQVIFEENEIVKSDGEPYTVFTPYKNQWLSKFQEINAIQPKKLKLNNLHKGDYATITLEDIGFKKSDIPVPDFDLTKLDIYGEQRDFPYEDITSYLSPHLRFGTISIRQVIARIDKKHEVFMSELIWREFFMQILFHFPKVVTQNFRPKYDNIQWRNNKEEFELWCQGKTGYPMVDAGMRQLNNTGFMHNRVRMITAGFLCKHLLIDWRWGESYFAKKLLDYELSSNNGNWQWAAGTGCDAAPYFRVFNPLSQQQKFDKDYKYVRKWIPEFDTFKYPDPIVEHKFARERALKAYKIGIGS
ncbi:MULTISPECIES: deoxyribodipyrimidine photo-lyase [unclassified Arenibacter]|uniref:cryptochrome/photolyase family protein n=1 Tax=unclassified Arenibacter TaxID=2615047 RepID=UPI000E3519CE|nr:MULTISPECIES: deoxyribodipyrimidine photo-lyase [unclassified Arenibacter]MCM4164969.1 deoxyribodipyrimidine photolyase [Arenibacter sp. A80]RFT55377.1 deoxyribodipyrimidine photo-lyase [Arenibacter sp. P308M17]